MNGFKADQPRPHEGQACQDLLRFVYLPTFKHQHRFRGIGAKVELADHATLVQFPDAPGFFFKRGLILFCTGAFCFFLPGKDFYDALRS